MPSIDILIITWSLVALVELFLFRKELVKVKASYGVVLLTIVNILIFFSVGANPIVASVGAILAVCLAGVAFREEGKNVS